MHRISLPRLNHRQTSWRQALYELTSSMRFAISLLVLIAVASVIGTVIPQNRPYISYVAQFGEFWTPPFEKLGLFDVYHALWFLLLLGFLVLSTSLCIVRHTPRLLRNLSRYRERATLKSLRSLPYSATFAFADAVNAAEEAHGASTSPESRRARMQGLRTHAENWLGVQGYRWRVDVRADGILLAAKRGSLQRFGYLFTHGAIVLICLGGLLDGNLVLQAQSLLGWRAPESNPQKPIAQIAPQSRLGADNLAFRSSLELTEGERSSISFLPVGRGFYVQELPFILHLKKFEVEYYSSGQPKSFLSTVEVTDRASGRMTAGEVAVNRPLEVDGISIYQASFGDGGSPMRVRPWSLGGKRSGADGPLALRSQRTETFNWQGRDYTLEMGELRPINVFAREADEEDRATPPPGAVAGSPTFGQPALAPLQNLSSALRDARSVQSTHAVRNVGPSIQFKVRDAAGQAKEYINYLTPFVFQGERYLLSGLRRADSAEFAYLRIPLDAEGQPDSFFRFTEVLFDEQRWPAFATQLAREALPDIARRPPAQRSASQRKLYQDFQYSVRAILQHFAAGGFAEMESGLGALPVDQRNAILEAAYKMLERAAMQVVQTLPAVHGTDARADAKPDGRGAQRYRFVLDSLLALSARADYGDLYLQPVDFTPLPSSGFQFTRSPARVWVYLGCALLVLGLVLMFYLRERRLWLWISSPQDVPEASNRATTAAVPPILLAYTSNQQDRQAAEEFSAARAALEQIIRVA